MKAQGLHKLNNLLETVNLRNQELLTQLQSDYKSRESSPPKPKQQIIASPQQQSSEVYSLQERNKQLVEDLNFLNLSYKELKLGTDELNSKNQSLKKHVKELLQALKHKEDELKKAREKQRNGEQIEENKTSDKSVIEYAIYMEKQFQTLEDKVKKYKKLLEKNGIDEQFTKKVEEQRKIIQQLTADKETIKKEKETLQKQLQEKPDQSAQLKMLNEQIQNNEKLHIQETQLKDKMIEKLNNQLIKFLDSQKALDDSKKVNQLLQSRISEQDKKYKDLDDQASSINQTAQEYLKQIQSLNREINSQKQQISQKEEEYSALLIKKQREIQQIQQQAEQKAVEEALRNQQQNEQKYRSVIEQFNQLQNKIDQLEDEKITMKQKAMKVLLKVSSEMKKLKLELQNLKMMEYYDVRLFTELESMLVETIRQKTSYSVQEVVQEESQEQTITERTSEQRMIQKGQQPQIAQCVDAINVVLEVRGNCHNLQQTATQEITKMKQQVTKVIEQLLLKSNEFLKNQKDDYASQIESLVSELNNVNHQIYESQCSNSQLQDEVDQLQGEKKQNLLIIRDLQEEIMSLKQYQSEEMEMNKTTSLLNEMIGAKDQQITQNEIMISQLRQQLQSMQLVQIQEKKQEFEKEKQQNIELRNSLKKSQELQEITKNQEIELIKRNKALEIQQQNLQSQLDKYKNEAILQLSQIEDMKTVNRKLQQENTISQNTIEKQHHELLDLKQQLEELETAFSNINEINAQLKQQMLSKDQELCQLQLAQIQEKKQELEKEKQQNIELRNSLKKSQELQEITKNQEIELIERNKALEIQQQNLQSQLDKYKNEAILQLSQIEDMKTVNRKLQQENTISQNTIEKQHHELLDLKQQLEELKPAFSNINEINAQLKQQMLSKDQELCQLQLAQIQEKKQELEKEKQQNIELRNSLKKSQELQEITKNQEIELIERNKALEIQQQNIQSQLDKYKNEAILQLSQIEDMKTVNRKLQQENTISQNTIEKQHHELLDLKQQLEELEAAFSNINEINAQLKQQMLSKDQELYQLQLAQIQEKKQELEKEKQQNIELRNSLKKSQELQEITKNQEIELIKRNKALEIQQQNLQSQLDKYKNEAILQLSQIEDMKTVNRKLQQENTISQNTIEKQHHELLDLKQQFEELEAAFSNINEINVQLKQQMLSKDQELYQLQLAQIQEKKQELEKEKQQNIELRNSLKKSQELQEITKHQEIELIKRNKALEIQQQNFQSQLDKYKNQAILQLSQIEDMKTVNRKLQQENTISQNTIEKQHHELLDLKQQLEELEAAFSNINEINAQLKQQMLSKDQELCNFQDKLTAANLERENIRDQMNEGTDLIKTQQQQLESQQQQYLNFQKVIHVEERKYLTKLENLEKELDCAQIKSNLLAMKNSSVKQKLQLIAIEFSKCKKQFIFSTHFIVQQLTTFNNHYKHKMLQIAQQLYYVNQQIQIFKQQHQELEKMMSGKVKINPEIYKALSQLQGVHESAVRIYKDKIGQMQIAQDNLQSADGNKKQEIEHLNNEKNELKNQNLELQAKWNQLSQTIQEQNLEISQMQSSIILNQGQIHQKNNQIDALNEQLKQIAILKNEQQIQEQSKQQLQNSILELQAIIDHQQEQIQSLTDENRSLLSGQVMKTQDIYQKMQKKEQSLATEKQLNQQLIDKLQSKNEEIEALKISMKKISAETEELGNKIEDLKDENENLKEQGVRFQVLCSEREETLRQIKEANYQKNSIIEEKDKKNNQLSGDVEVLKKKLHEAEDMAKLNDARTQKLKQQVIQIHQIRKKYPVIQQDLTKIIQINKEYFIEKINQLHQLFMKKIQKLQEENEYNISAYEQDISKLKKQLQQSTQQFDEMFSNTLTMNNENPDMMAHFKQIFNKSIQEKDQLAIDMNEMKEKLDKLEVEKRYLALQLQEMKDKLEQQWNESVNFSLDLSSIDNQEIRKFEHSSINNNNEAFIEPTVQSGHTKSSLQIGNQFQNQFAHQIQQNENNNTRLYDLTQELEYHKVEIEKYKVNLMDYQAEEQKMVKMISDLKRENSRLQQVIDQTDYKSLKLQIKQLLQSLLVSLQNSAQETEGYFSILSNMLELTEQERCKFALIVTQLNSKKKGGIFSR